MEDFRGITEESFPSFLTSSFLNNSGILENVTLSSNLGLPVAVSTLARNRSSTENRCSDIQASYLVERRFSVPSESSHSSQSDAEPKERLQLRFQDDEKKNQMETQHLSVALIKESASQSDAARVEGKQAAAMPSFQGQGGLDGASSWEQVQGSPIDFCVQSWMNNKDHEIIITKEEKTPNSDFSRTVLLENEKLMSLASFEDSSDDDIDDEEFYDDHLEAYFEQLAIPGMIYEDLEGQEPSEKDFQLPTSNPSQANENSTLKANSRSENSSSLTSLGFHAVGSAEMNREGSEESHAVCPPGTNNSVGTEDNRRHVDGVLPFSSSTLRIEKETGRAESLEGIAPDHSRVAESPHQNRHLASGSEAVLHLDGCLDTEIPEATIQKKVDVASLKPVNDNRINSTDVLRSPTSERRACVCYESVGKNKDQMDLPQGVVYQNEEGKWVTDLAYYTSFNKEENLNMSLTNEMNEDFRTGSEALAMIERDEEEFNKEHQFIQEENIDGRNTSDELGDTSWGISVNYNLLRKSLSTSDLDKNDASYLRLSLGEFFAQRSEALGCLGGDNNVKRASVFTNSKPRRHKDEFLDNGDSVLRISTIASAIANASVNTDPSQLAAMIKALSNKARDKTFQEDEKQKDCSIAPHFLPYDLEKSSESNAFDMEKYLKKTEVSRCEGGLENFSRGGVSDIWDLSLSKEQTPQAFHTGDLGATNISVREPEEKTAAIFYSENGQNENQESFRIQNSSNLSTIREDENVVGDVVTCSTDTKLPDVSNGEKPTSHSTPAPDGYPLVRNSKITPVWLLEDCEQIQINSEDQRQNEYVIESSSSEKHVTFDKHSIISPEDVDLKDTSPEQGDHGSEDGQDSFRPSTSPLSHSSPSEVSGTSSSGFALESLGSASCHLKPPCESALSQLVCARASMSRLTYMPECESTYPTSASDGGLEDHKSDITSELSTTIIQASPTPSEEQTLQKLKEKVPFQSKEKGTLSYVIQNDLDKKKVTETTYLTSKTEDVKPNVRLCKDPSSKKGDLFETNLIGLAQHPKESDQIHAALLNKSCLGNQALSVPADVPVSSQASVDKGPRITPQDMLTGHRNSSGQDPNQMASGTQYPPVPSFPVDSTAPEMQSLPAAGPALLARQSLATAAFVPHYLGALPSAGNVALPQCHVGRAAVCGFSGACPYPAISGEQVPSSVAVGLCLGQNVTSGLVGTSSLCDPYADALNQNLFGTAKPFPMQSVGTSCAVEPWDAGMMSRSGSVRVPEELKFPHACCVGIASQTHLPLLNPTDHWLQVSVGVLSVSVDGEKVDLSTYPCLVFKNKVIVRPHTTEEIKVLFIPSSPGIFRCIFSVASWPFSADVETIVQAEALASRVILTAIAESPVIEVETEKEDVLDFGDLTYGSWKALPLKLMNRTHATVPVRLIINANVIAWRCFTFSRKPVDASMRAAPYADVVAQLAAPSVINQVMRASCDGQDPEFLIVWVLFHSPRKRISSSEILDSAEEFLARVDIEVDSPNPTPVIKSVCLRARAGIARIHAPKDLQTMHLFACMGSSTKQHLPLKNAGNIEVYLDNKIPGQGSHFSVDPENLFLKPGEEHEVIVSFTPKNPKACEERILKIFVLPFGPQYEVVLKGEVISSENKPLATGSCSDVPSILSNRQFLAWGGVPLGRAHLQKLVLRNNSASVTQHLRLLIRGQDQDCFQLQNTFGSEERLTSNCEIRIHPKEDINICILFAPTRLSCMLAKLEIKQLGIRSQPGIKFTIPLSGYGGTSNLILEDVKKLSDSYMVMVNGLIPGKESRIVFSVRNTGSRAAFVKAVCFKDSQKRALLDPKVMRIFPDKFVLKERTQENVTIIYNPSDRESSCKTATELSTVYFFGGDEILRQQYRRALLPNPGIIEQILPEYSLLQSINFAETFQDELLVTEVYDLPQQPNDVQLFYGSMRKIILSIIGEFRDCVSSREPSSRTSLELTRDSGPSEKHSGNVSLDVLPVKGPQGSPLASQASPPAQDKSASEETWTVHPGHLILLAPASCEMAKTGRFRILNNSVTSLKFELYWPAHCLTVTPQHGVIAPESKLQILVSPNSSLSTKYSTIPWSGLIYIHCDNGQKKIVKVQIREDLTPEELPFTKHVASSPFRVLPPGSELSFSHLLKPVTKPPSTKVEIRNKNITFPTTEPGETSENYLELENHGNTEVKWHLSSLAPPYVKGVDQSGDVFRATYAAFRCSPISGVLKSHGIQKVSITFLPRDRGNYAQFWDVECHPLKEPHVKHTLRFQLSGQSVKAEKEPENACISTDTLIKIDDLVKPRREVLSESSALLPGQVDLSHRGVYAPEDVYMFLPTRVGESRTLKINLRNNSFITHSLKFLSPREPFYVKHSKYSLRAQHYINMPVQFKPKSVGRFEALLVIQTDEGKSVAIRLIGEALEKN
ncbi:centrosomal protein of 192 kDa isoform X2 [Choloepus didactylus]|uniref:centrosomal protein of 192 kDa isoform X2 n=1 Tax=Choloepus didactylus TaxID=27675 RepID=UPI0018A0F47A|nr:centrosomal protein of 192 kDa isoform X2 [Choloepus didactylus]